MTPNEFEAITRGLAVNWLDDPEAYLDKYVRLMEDTLKALGYRAGVDLCNKLRWY